MFCLEGDEAENLATTVSGTLLLKHLYAHVVFDSGAIHSFVNPVFVKKLASKPHGMDVQLYVTTPLGSTYYTDIVFKNCTIQLEGTVLSVYLVPPDIQGWDLILGMDWLTKYKVTIDCEKKLVTFSTPDGERMTFKGSGHQVTIPTVFAMQAFKMMRKGCQAICLQLRPQNQKN